MAGVAAAAGAPLTEVALLAVPDRANDGVMGDGTANRKEDDDDDDDDDDGVEAADEGADSEAERNAGGSGG